MLPNFIYLPPDGQSPAQWINLSLVLAIHDYDNALHLISDKQDSFEYLAIVSGRQADVLRRHLTGRAMSYRPEPELPPITRSAIPAAEQLEARLERRGVIQ